MEQIFFGERIAALRRGCGLTQEALAKQLGITNQAVSKWESDQCCPDIMLFPVLAQIFGVTTDELFGLERPALPGAQEEGQLVAELPWPDDDSLRAVCYHGRRLIRWMDNGQEYSEKKPHFFRFSGDPCRSVELCYTGSVENVYSVFSVKCTQSTVNGDIIAGDSISCEDCDIGGDVTAGDGIVCGNIGGNANAGDGIRCQSIGGSAAAGDDIYCVSIGGNASAGDSVHLRTEP